MPGGSRAVEGAEEDVYAVSLAKDVFWGFDVAYELCEFEGLGGICLAYRFSVSFLRLVKERYEPGQGAVLLLFPSFLSMPGSRMP